jgi:ferredoxin
VTLLLQSAPVRLERRDGDGSELIATRIELGPADASGRRRPMPVPDSDFSIPVDAIIAAVSQEPDFEGLETLLTDGRLRADEGLVEEDVLAGGDALVQGIAAQAIVQGRLAAEALHARLRHEQTPPPATSRPQASSAALLTDFYPPTRAARRPQLAPSERLAVPTVEVTSGLVEAAFLSEAARCLSCGSCFGCQQCAMFCTSSGFLTLGQPEPGRYFALTLDQCEECGKCVSVCPCGYLEVEGAATPSTQA